MSASVERRTLSLLITDPPRTEWETLSPDDWSALLPLAHAEGVGPLVYWRLSHSGKFSLLPEEVRNFLRAMYAGTWSKNQRIFKELEILSGLFQQAGISAVLLKGACYALTIYPDIGLRPMGDLDLLVSKAQFAEAVQIARSLGFVDSKPEASPGLKDLLNHEACLVNLDGSVVLEIHHSLVADRTFTYSAPVDWFWEQIEPLPIVDARLAGLRMLTPAAQVLYAASHAMLQHGGHTVPLRWEYDIDQLLCAYVGRLDWELLLSQARAFAWGSALRAALARTQEYFDTPIPTDRLVQLSQFTDRHTDLVALKQTRPATHILEEGLKLLSLNWAGRLRLVWALLFPSPAYMRWRYQFHGSWALPWYYLARWGGILKDGFRTAHSIVWSEAPVE
jgi:hypothetical protein